MTDLPEVVRYNAWGHRKILIARDRGSFQAAQEVTSDGGPVDYVDAAKYFRHMAKVDGLEFVAFSNMALDRHVTLAGQVIIVPCFLPHDQIHNTPRRDPLFAATTLMRHRGRFVYDGWVPITDWSDRGISEALRRVDEALSLFALFGHIRFEWKPKYLGGAESNEFLVLDAPHFDDMQRALDAAGALPEADRDALWRSLGWLAEATYSSNEFGRFFFSVLSIETLATFIEETSNDGSPLVGLRGDRSSRKERKQRKVDCIKELLSREFDADPIRCISSAYFDCVVGIKSRLKQHLSHVFGANDASVRRLFERKDGESPLYELRGRFAHGDLDALSEEDRLLIRTKGPQAEGLARSYLLAVMRRCLGYERRQSSVTVVSEMTAGSMMGVGKVSYSGPTHMAYMY